MYLTNSLSLNCNNTKEGHYKLLKLYLKGDYRA